jgi:phage shock protein E
MPQQQRRFICLAIALLVVGGCGPAPDAETLTGEMLLARIDAGDAPLTLDVRTPGEFAAGHIPGAVNIPHDAVAERFAELGVKPDDEIVVYCQSGRRAALAEDVLAGAGFRRVRHLEGDFAGWQADGRPVTTGPGS